MLASERGWSNVPLERVQWGLLGVAPLPSCVVAGSAAGHLDNICMAHCHNPAGQLPGQEDEAILSPTPNLKQGLLWAFIPSPSLNKEERAREECD